MAAGRVIVETVHCRRLEPADYPGIRQIIAGAFADHIRDNPVALKELAAEPWYDPDHLLVAERDGEVVSFLGVRDSGLWVGGRLFPAGLVGTVCTREELRGRGIGSRLLGCAHAWMAGRGLVLSTLHTSETRYAFYERLGYRRAVIERPRLRVDLAAVVPARGLEVRRAGPGDAVALGELYAATYGRTTGAWARSEAFWERRLRGVPKLWSRVLTFAVAGGGTARAYVAYEETAGGGTVQELGCASGAETEAVELLEHLLTRWRDRGAPAAELALSSGHPLRSPVAHLVAEDRTGWDVVFIGVRDEARWVEGATVLLRERWPAGRPALAVKGGEGGVVLEAETEASGPLRLELTELAALLYNGRLAATHEALAGEMVRRPWTERLFPDTGAARCGLDAY